jgi:hypothetical protein
MCRGDDQTSHPRPRRDNQVCGKLLRHANSSVPHTKQQLNRRPANVRAGEHARSRRQKEPPRGTALAKKEGSLLVLSALSGSPPFFVSLSLSLACLRRAASREAKFCQHAVGYKKARGGYRFSGNCVCGEQVTPAFPDF